MEWNKIKIKPIMFILRKMEEETPALFQENYVIYSDGKEELKISYRKLERK